MTEKEDILNKINKLVEEYFSLGKRKFIPGESKIPLIRPSYGSEEVNESIESLLTTWVTMGKKVKNFEEIFSQYMRVKDSIMVNSGSSANLIALSVLTNPTIKNKIPEGSEIITPATTWATTIYPIANVNCVPVIVDVDLDTFNINVEAIEKAITPKTKAIMPVHLLGNPCDIKRIMEIAEKHNLYVIEDSCESHGAEVDGKKVGTFGDMGTFSFFFSHHISTIEGGMVITNNELFGDLSRALRVFGWARSMKKYDEYAEQYKDIDKRFLFMNTGFNFRPTEVQGAFGIHQMKKIDKFVNIRRENAKFWIDSLEKFSDYLVTQKERPGTKHSWFSFPITVKPDAPFRKDELANYLENKKIETRPIQIPNMLKQPAMSFIKHRVSGELNNADFIMKNSFWFGNSHDVKEQEKQYIVDCISDFMRSKV